MFLYTPTNVQAHPPVLVASHFCTGTAQALLNGTDFDQLADQFGFLVIYPEATRSGSCFDVSSAATLTHNGGSDSMGIVSMVNWVIANRNGDASRVYATGVSSGAMMTDVLLGAYPDVFKAGAAFMGVPYWCFRTDDPSMWNNACANGQSTMTPQAWGDLVRNNGFRGFTGTRPRMQVFHGTADTTLNFVNFGEEIKQWTNVLGVSQTPVMTDTPQSGWTRTRYGNNTAQAPVEAIQVQGVGHSLPLAGQAMMAIVFLGLNGTPASSQPASSSRPASSQPASSSRPASSSPASSIQGNPGGCNVRFVQDPPWNTGYTANMTITNNGAAINGWSLVFTLPAGQTIVQNGWNANYTPKSGQVTATDLGYNASIPAGGSISSVGFQVSHTGNSSKPTAFTLNGRSCTVS